MKIRRNAPPTSHPCLHAKKGNSITTLSPNKKTQGCGKTTSSHDLNKVIEAGFHKDNVGDNSDSISRAKMALVQYLRSRRLPLSLVSDTAVWEKIARLLTSPKKERRDFWQRVFIETLDDVDERLTVCLRLSMMRFDKDSRFQAAIEVGEAFYESAIDMMVLQNPNVTKDGVLKELNRMAA